MPPRCCSSCSATSARPGGGLNALRGHANIQGGTDCGMAYHNLPGYIAVPKADHGTLGTFLTAVTPKSLRPNSTNFWSGTDRFMVSQLKAYYGAAATQAERFRLPVPSQAAAVGGGRLRELELGVHLRPHVPRRDGRLLQLRDEPGQQRAALAQGDCRALEVEVDGRRRELRAGDLDVLAARHSRLVGLKPEDVKTEVFMLPAANFAEKDGTFVNSARWIQWKWKAVDPPGEAKPDQEIIARIFLKVRELYEQEGGTFPEPIRNLNWWYTNAASPSLDEVCKELNGWALEDVRDASGAVTMRAGQQLSRFADARADGSTLSGNWLYIGMYTDAGNLTQRRSNADPSGMGRYPEWTVSWPANRRILYNRASADAQGRPGIRRASASPGTVSAGSGTRRTTPSTARPMPVWARSSCSRKAWRGCSCPASSSRVRGRSTTSRRSRRSPTRCTPSTAPIRPSVRSAPNSTCSARRRVSDRLHDVPAHGALPLLDQEQSVQRAAAAGVLRRDS